MPPSSKLYFASSNKHKFDEAQKILSEYDIDLEFFKCNLLEVQSDNIRDIAIKKAREAFCLCKNSVIVEDDGLFLDSLNGFPGPYSSYVFKTIGNDGILKLVKKNKHARFQSVITYCDKDAIKSFTAELKGKISNNSQGIGWGYDPIFIPIGKSKTYAELRDKNKISHRYKALKKFANWYQNR